MPERGEAAQARTQAAGEEVCLRCGKCCYQKVIIGRGVYITPFPCDFLDPQTNLCRIYARRFELNLHCLSVATGLKLRAFPAGCAYVAALAPKDYRPAVEGRDWSAEWAEFDQWADDMEVSAEVRQMVRARGPKAPPLYVETNALRPWRPAGSGLRRQCAAEGPR